MKPAMTFGDQIRAARGLLDLSRDELAEKSGVSVRTLVHIEDGSGNPKPATIEQIRTWLHGAGVQFVNSGGMIGVGFRRGKRK